MHRSRTRRRTKRPGPDGVVVAALRWAPWLVAAAGVALFAWRWVPALSEETRRAFSIWGVAFGDELLWSFAAPLATFFLLGTAVTEWRRRRLTARLAVMARGRARSTPAQSELTREEYLRVAALQRVRRRRLLRAVARRAVLATAAVVAVEAAAFGAIVAMDRGGFSTWFVAFAALVWLLLAAIVWGTFALGGSFERRFGLRGLVDAFRTRLDRENLPLAPRTLDSVAFARWLDLHWAERWDGDLSRATTGVATVVDGYPACLRIDRRNEGAAHILLAARLPDADDESRRAALVERWTGHAGWLAERRNLSLSVTPAGPVVVADDWQVRCWIDDARDGADEQLLTLLRALAATARDLDAPPVVLPAALA